MSKLIAEENKKSQTRKGFKSAFVSGDTKEPKVDIEDAKPSIEVAQHISHEEEMYDPQKPTLGWD